jgi:Domain of unknown function (DUF4326)
MTLAEHIAELRQEVRGALTRRERNAVQAELAQAIAAQADITAAARKKDLICWCAPARCHAEVLIELANR